MSGKAKRDRSNRNLAQYGIFDIPSMNDGAADLDGNDSDLEAELLALASGGGSKPKRPQRKNVAPAANLNAMIAESLRDIPSDEELSDGEDDPDLLNELSEMTGDGPEVVASPKRTQPETDLVTTLQNRLKMYETAQTNATTVGETSRARRFGRGIKTLQDLIKQANAGRNINIDEIPPEVAVTIKPKQDTNQVAVEDTNIQPTRPAPSLPSVEQPENESSPKAKSENELQDVSPPKVSSENEELLKLLNDRRDEYKRAALQAKKSGDSVSAIQFIKTAKQFEMVIKAVEEGQPVDLSQMPGPPSQVTVRIEQSETQKESPGEVTEPPPAENLPAPSLITASSVAEALQQRLEVYQKQEQSANEQGNSSKARRMGRIVKQFQDAIKLNNAGKPIPVEDLPTPPGYGPIPVPVAKTVDPPKPPPVEKTVQPKPIPSQPKIVKKNSAQTRIDKQVEFLKARQKEFKDAALNAKKKGEMEQAKEYLRTVKGFDPLIDAAQGGLPIDVATLPVPPLEKSQLDEEYEIIMAEDGEGDIDPEHLDILSRLEQQLTKQLKMALSTRDHNKAIGDIAGMNRFEQLALSVTRDLDIVRVAKKKANNQLPKFHYETKNFSIVKSFTELNDNDLQLTIIRGINYNCTNPDSIDTYVKFEFPYPQEEPVRNKTAIIKDTNNPQYDETFTLPFQRSARPCLRVFKRHSIKLEIYSKGCFASDWACCFRGFFRGDTLLGTVAVKLQPLETQCELHESFDLLDGRKKVGGKLEVRLRVRDPLVTRQIEQLSEKWLVLDH